MVIKGDFPLEKDKSVTNSSKLHKPLYSLLKLKINHTRPFENDRMASSEPPRPKNENTAYSNYMSYTNAVKTDTNELSHIKRMFPVMHIPRGDTNKVTEIIEVSSESSVEDEFYNKSNLPALLETKDVFTAAIQINKILINSTILYQRDLMRLLPGRWLNDKIINVYFGLLEKASPKIKIFSTFFLPGLLKKGSVDLNYKDAALEWSKYDFLFFPIHLTNHWVLYVYSKGKVYVYDSLGPRNTFSDPVFYDLGLLLLIFSRIFGKSVSLKSMKNIPRQTNGDDCGVFVCMFAKCIAYGLPFHLNVNTKNFRRKLLREILSEKIDHKF